MHDIISHSLTCIRNGQKHRRRFIIFTYSIKIIPILQILLSYGYIAGYFIKSSKVQVFLRYWGDQPVICVLRRVSIPSRKIYWNLKRLKYEHYIDSNGIYILNTSLGCISSYTALLRNIGGEVICKIN